MRCGITTIATLTLLLYTAGLAVGQQFSSAGLACVADMPIPVYRGLFWVARVTGEAKVTITIGPGGAPVSIDVQSVRPQLVAWLKSSLQPAVFLDRCIGQTLEINLIYRLAGTPNAEPLNEIRIKGPNTFEITARNPIPIPPQP